MSLSKSGYIKAVAVHMKTSLGRPMENAKEIVRQVKQYEAKNPDLIVFGELSISGYSCGDLFLQSFMDEQCRMAITYLCDNLPQSDTLIAVGAPLRKDGMLFCQFQNAVPILLSVCFDRILCSENLCQFGKQPLIFFVHYIFLRFFTTDMIFSHRKRNSFVRT